MLTDRIFNMEQKSSGWLRVRLGKITASNFGRVMDITKKGGEGATKKGYRFDVVAQILTGELKQNFVNASMQWGIDHEEDAREMYSNLTGSLVQQVGFVCHPTIKEGGCSPDGLVLGDDGQYIGGVEIKCPETSTHIRWMLDGVIPEEHMWQVIYSMACMPELEFYDFVSYDPRLPDPIKMFRVRITRDEAAPNVMIANAEAQTFINTAYDVIHRLAEIAKCDKEVLMQEAAKKFAPAPPPEEEKILSDTLLTDADIEEFI